MEELADLLHIGDDVGIAIVIVIFGYLVVRVIITSVVKMVEIWERTAQARLVVETERNKIDDKMASAVAEFAASQERIEAGTTKTQSLLSTQAHESRMAHGTTQAAVERVEMTLNSGNEKGDHQRKRIAEQVANNGTKLDELKKMIDELSAKITQGIVPPEIAASLSRISLKIDECITQRTAKVPEKTEDNKPKEA
jgi:ribosomal protein L16 Arg81 hydroxylase